MHELIRVWFLWVREGGYLGIIALMAMESSILPVPSEIVIPPAAYWASEGQLNIWLVLLAGTFGSWLGSAISYWVARVVGKVVVVKYGRYFLVSEHKLEMAERWLHRYEAGGIFSARLLPVIRHLVSIPAGFLRMDFGVFSLFTVIGSGIWCGVLAWFGREVIGSHPELIEHPVELIEFMKAKSLLTTGMVVMLCCLYFIGVQLAGILRREGMMPTSLKGIAAQFRMPRPSALVLAGLGGFLLYGVLSAWHLPTEILDTDALNFRYYAKQNFAYASSGIDTSVMSPVQGLAGLDQPIAVWLDPAYLLPHLLGAANPRPLGFLADALLMGVATFLLARACGLPSVPALIAGQITGMFFFLPMLGWCNGWMHLNGEPCYLTLFALGFQPGLGTLLLAVLARLGHAKGLQNAAYILLLPLVLVYAIILDPLYTAMYFVPIALFMGGVFLGSESREIFLWRAAGGCFCGLVCLMINLPGFYHALAGYAARAAFPNELYVEVQEWGNYTALIFQGGLATPAVLLLMAGCVLGCIFGSAQVRGLAAAVLLFVLATIVYTLMYVYSGIHWNMPLPVYLEMGAHATYVVTGILGFWAAWKALWARLATRKQKAMGWLKWPALRYAAVLLLPAIGCNAIYLFWDPRVSGFGKETQIAFPPPMGIVKYLEDELAITGDGHFRGSVASILGVPGGGLMNHLGKPPEAPFTKWNISVLGAYFQSVDANFFGPLTGFWSIGIPTLEDNSTLVTPPFHFLISRALSRPQDYHSRNWTLITKARPALMAALGVRFLLSDKTETNPRLTLQLSQHNAEGVPVNLYEIERPNVGDYSPTHSIISNNALYTVGVMESGVFPFETTAIVDQPLRADLTPAESSAMYFEPGGVRVKAKSSGTSLVVLPVQFSNSLKIISTAGKSAGAPVRLQRVNLLETGVLFRGEIDIKIAHVFGLFRGIDGRLQDIEDCKRLGIKETGEIPYPPNYQPLAAPN